VPAALPLLLASTSPRRSELLTRAGIPFVLTQPGDEPAGAGTPLELAVQRARAKAEGAPSAAGAEDVLVLGVDTVVDVDGVEFGKARDEDHAREILQAMSGRRHGVHTGHCLVRARDGSRFEEVCSAEVDCEPWGAAMERYAASGEWRGKAGGYGIQDPGCTFAALVSGALDTVVGLNVAAVRRLLAEARG